MSMYYYNFKAERKLENWQEQAIENGNVVVSCMFENETAGDYILLWNVPYWWDESEPEVLSINGTPADEQSDYLRGPGSRKGREVVLCKGTNVITAELKPNKYSIDNFYMNLIPAHKKTVPPKGHFDFIAPEAENFFADHVVDHTGYTPCLNRETAPGRFGFRKGYGFLDCAMPWFGHVNKMFPCGHPNYLKPYAWHYSISQNQQAEENGKESIEINPLSIRWSKGPTSYICSLASPGIITENNSGKLTISKLEFAGNYSYILTSQELCAIDDFSGNMPENWFMLFGAEFPDFPLLTVLQQKPEKIEFSRLNDGRLAAVTLHGCSRMMTATPFGFDMRSTCSPSDQEFIADAINRCRFWSRASLAYPVRCRDYFKNDFKRRKVSIVQEFEYHTATDEWQTEPLYLAPLPPVLTIGQHELPNGAIDFCFPTKYGYLYGFTGTSCAYEVDMMVEKRKFPLRSVNSKIPQLLSEGLEDFFEFEGRFSTEFQSYAYPGAILEGYAYSSSVANFMPVEKRDLLAKKLSERLKLACDPERQYTLLLTDHGMLFRTEPDKEEVYRYYTDPELGRLRMYNSYKRTDPFTGCSYDVCYFNVGLMMNGHIKTGSRQEVKDYGFVFMENDWGLGLTLYMMYQSALTSGDLSAIKENWAFLKSLYRFLDIMQDWACMGAGYAENGWTWCEGSNYGAFTSFINLSQMVGDNESYEYATALAAKMLVCSRSRLYSGGYFAKCFHVPPWHGERLLQEEHETWVNFQYVPDNLFGEQRCLPTGISMQMTDAIYPELFESFREASPKVHREIMDIYRKSFHEGMKSNRVDFTYALMNDALDETVPAEVTRNGVELAIQTGRFLREWHDINRFENFLPVNFMKSQIFAWLEMRDHALWLEQWQGLRIRDALWDNGTARIEVVATAGEQKVLCGIRKYPQSFQYSSGECSIRQVSEKQIEFILTGTSGVLTVNF